jgi:hypothetical protein
MSQSIEKKRKNNKNTWRSQSIKKIYEHMKAHKQNKLAMFKIKTKRSYQREEYNSNKNSTHLHYFDLRVWRFSLV